MLGLGSTLADTTSDRRDDYKSLTSAAGNNKLISGSFDDSAGVGNLPHTTAGNGIPFSTNYTTSSTFRGSYTISFWYKSADGRDLTRSKILLSVGGGESSLDYFYLYLTTAGTFQVLGSSNGGVFLGLTTSQALADGAIDWHHLALTVTGGGGSNTVFSIYVNGVAATMVPIIQLSSTNHAAFDADGGLHVAGAISNLLAATVFPINSIRNNDFIDDFCLHSSALDADNVAAIYNSGTPINLLANSGNYDTSGDVVLYYKFDGENGPNGTGLDSHGTSNGTGGQFSTEGAS